MGKYVPKKNKKSNFKGCFQLMKEAHADEASMAEALFLQMAKQIALGEEVKPLHMIGEFVLIYKLFPHNIYSTTFMKLNEIMDYFKLFVKEKYNGEDPFTNQDYINASTQLWRFGIKVQDIRRKTVSHMKIGYINTDHKLAELKKGKK